MSIASSRAGCRSKTIRVVLQESLFEQNQAMTVRIEKASLGPQRWISNFFLEVRDT